MKYLVIYILPSGYHVTYATDDKQEAEAVAASEAARTGWVHEVVKRP